MIKRVLIPVVIALCAISVSCSDMLNQQAQKDRNLAHVMDESLSTSVDFQANYDGFKLVDIGKYEVMTKGLADAQSAGKYGYNVMVSLIERNNTKVQTGRTAFTLIGTQNGQQIFEVRYAGTGTPTVTLMGPYAGETFTKE